MIGYTDDYTIDMYPALYSRHTIEYIECTNEYPD